MATIKSYTDLEQSKKLAEILPLESADMCWQYQKDRWVGEPDYKEFPQFEHATDKRDILCWSLASLLGVLPKIINNETLFIETSPALWHIGYRNVYTARTDNPVDACYEMILKLHELKML